VAKAGQSGGGTGGKSGMGALVALLALALALGAAHERGRTAPPAAVVVRGSDLADPSVLAVAGTLYAYGTNTVFGGHVPVLTSGDGRTWRRAGDALPTLPGWAAPADTFSTWAPAVTHVGSGYRLYYTTRSAATGTECVSVASARRPAGPFRDSSDRPLVCQADVGGSIDPSPYSAGGQAYLTWKSEGRGPGATSVIWAARLRPDGEALSGPAVALLRPDRPWQDSVVEAPAMLTRDGGYQLVFAAGDWRGQNYVTGVATCAGPLGPCQSAGAPVLTSGPGAPSLHGRTGIALGVAPGGASVFLWGTRWWMAFHTWPFEPETIPDVPRQLVIAPLPEHGRPVPDLGAVARGAVTERAG